MDKNPVEEKQTSISDPQSARPLVIALPVNGSDECAELAQALARDGHLLALVSEGIQPAPGGPVEPTDENVLLDLQLAIERAGGISLAGTGTALDWVVDAFGRLNVICTWSEEQAVALTPALAGLGRRSELRRIVILSARMEPATAESHESDQIEPFNPGLKNVRVIRHHILRTSANQSRDESKIEAAVQCITGGF